MGEEGKTPKVDTNWGAPDRESLGTEAIRLKEADRASAQHWTLSPFPPLCRPGMSNGSKDDNHHRGWCLRGNAWLPGPAQLSPQALTQHTLPAALRGERRGLL